MLKGVVKMEKTENRQNRDFVQIYRSFMDEIALLGRENQVALELFMFISKHMDNNNALCVSMKALEELLGYSRQTLSKAVKHLKEKGWLCVLKSGSTNIYIINPDVAWTSYDGQKKYCKFQTNVIVTASENAEYLKNREASFKYKHIDDGFIDGIREKKQAKEQQISDMQDNRAFDKETGEIFEENLEEEPYYA